MPAGVFPRTKEHGNNISKAKKGCSQPPQCGFQKGHPLSNTGRTHFKKGLCVGDKSPNWKGGITLENHLLRTSTKYKEWQHSVFVRDNYTCQECGLIGVYFHAHHVKPFAIYPESRFDVDNGVTLCRGKCHHCWHGWKTTMSV